MCSEKADVMKCLVTGATGFVGTNLVHLLVEAGWDVRATGMYGSDNQYIKDLPIEFVYGDVTKSDELDALVSGCEIVFNVAGDTSFWKKYYARQRLLNVEAPSMIAEACLKHGVKRMVQTSTIDVFGFDPKGGVLNEDTGHFNFDKMGYHYGETKLEGDNKLRAYLSRGLKIVWIHPGFMVGPYDHTLQLGRLFFDLKKGNLPGVPDGGSSYCHVTEVARAHIAAATKGRSGESYICAGKGETNMTHREMWEKMASAVNASAPKLTLPRWALVLYGFTSETIAGFTGKPPELNPGMANYMTSKAYMSSDKAERELGYQIPDIEAGIRDALAWYRANGHEI